MTRAMPAGGILFLAVRGRHGEARCLRRPNRRRSHIFAPARHGSHAGDDVCRHRRAAGRARSREPPDRSRVRRRPPACRRLWRAVRAGAARRTCRRRAASVTPSVQNATRSPLTRRHSPSSYSRSAITPSSAADADLLGSPSRTHDHGPRVTGAGHTRSRRPSAGQYCAENCSGAVCALMVSLRPRDAPGGALVAADDAHGLPRQAAERGRRRHAPATSPIARNADVAVLPGVVEVAAHRRPRRRAGSSRRSLRPGAA